MPESPAATAAPSDFALRMRVFYSGFLLVGGVTVPFFPLWLQSRGLSAIEIANVIAIPALLRVFLTPLAGIYADRAPSRRFATITFSLPAALIFLLAWTAHGFLPILIITGVAYTSYGLAQPPAEALALTGVRRFGLDYGRMRLMGSLAFIVANLGSGALLGLFNGNSDAIFWSIAAALAGAAVVSFALPKTPPAIRALDDASRRDTRPSLAVLADLGLLAVLLASGFAQGSQAMLNSFASIHWQQLQFSGIQIGSLWAIGIVSEVSVFMWSRVVIRRTGPYALLVAGIIASMVRWTAFPFATDFLEFAILQALHGLTFAAVYAGSQSLIARIVPERSTASVQGIFAMISQGLLAAFTGLAGPIYQAVGVDGFFAMVPVAALALVIALAGRRFIERTA